MTVATQVFKVQAEGNGTATVFSFSPMVIPAIDDLEVVITDASGVETTITRGTGATNYIVTVAKFPGTGSVTYPATGATRLQTGEFITIKRLLILEQLTDLENQGGYFADTQEAAFDRLTMIALQQQEELDRVIKVPVSDLTSSLTIPNAATRANKVLAFDATGLPTVSSGVAEIAITPFIATVVDDASAAEVRTTLGLGALSVLNTVAPAQIDALAVETAKIAASAVTTAKIADNNVTLDKLDHGTQGDLLYYGATGTPTRLGAGTVGQVLTTQGAGADPAWGAAASTGFPRGHIFGLTLSNDPTDPTNDIGITTGEARDGGNTADMTLASALIKRLDAAWAVGTNQGGLDTGTIADTTYHTWLIKRSDTGVVDVLFSASATSPTMPTNYDLKRRIGSFVRSGSQIRAFVQTGDDFVNADGTATAITTTTGGSTITVAGIPTGIRVKVEFDLTTDFTAIDTGILLTDLSVASLAPSSTAAPGMSASPASTREVVPGLSVYTNTSAQIRERSTTASRTCRMYVRRWTDTRGRLA